MNTKLVLPIFFWNASCLSCIWYLFSCLLAKKYLILRNKFNLNSQKFKTGFPKDFLQDGIKLKSPAKCKNRECIIILKSKYWWIEYYKTHISRKEIRIIDLDGFIVWVRYWFCTTLFICFELILFIVLSIIQYTRLTLYLCLHIINYYLLFFYRTGSITYSAYKRFLARFC